MHLILRTYTLKLQHTFRISRQSFDSKSVLILGLQDGSFSGYGEASENPYSNEADDDGAVWRQVDFTSGAQVAIRPHRWEDAEVFALRCQEGEWGPFTPKNAGGAVPFPMAYLDDQPIDGHDVALWYVAHVHFDSAFPFTAGPWLRYSK